MKQRIQQAFVDQTEVVIQSVADVHFYGAGCETPQTAWKVHAALKDVFDGGTGQEVPIHVEHDLLAAARATCGSNPGIVAILGTGSNSCRYDGRHIVEQGPSLGYLLGDEGSGCDLGKTLVKEYMLGKMPADVTAKFRAKYDPNETLLQTIYGQQSPNAYLAHFSHFYSSAKGLSLESQSYLDGLAKQCFRTFVQGNLLQYKTFDGSSDESSAPSPIVVNFVGSVAFHFQHLIAPVLVEAGFKAGVFVSNPMHDEHNPTHSLICFHEKAQE